MRIVLKKKKKNPFVKNTNKIYMCFWMKSRPVNKNNNLLKNKSYAQ